MHEIPFVRFGMAAAAAAAVLSLPACGGSSGSIAPNHASGTGTWIAAWAGPMANDVPSTTDPASREQTFREIIKPSVGSRGTVRLHFSNALGATPVTLGAVHIGVQSSGATVATGTDTPVTFSNAASVTIAPGSAAVSDPVMMNFSYGAKLAVTEYVAGSWPALPQDYHAALITNYASAAGAGNTTSDVAGTSFTATFGEYFLFDRLDVYGNYTETVGILGSSTILGGGSDANAFDDIVSDVAADLHAAGRDDVGVVNLAFGPDALLTINVLANNPAIVDRFARDALSLPDVGAVIQAGADVDLKTSQCSNAATILAGDQNVIAQAHAAGVRIYLAKIAPTTYCNGQNPSGYGSRFPANTGQDAERQALNAWMSTTQPSVVDGVTVQPPGADGVIDIATPITDPTNTGYMLPQYDSGDDSHPNAAGQAVQASVLAHSPL